MPLPFEIRARFARNVSRPLRFNLHIEHACAVAALLSVSASSSVEAQSWSSSRARPPLRNIVSVDASGESVWPYGREDIAKDGLPSFAVDEAGADVRSVYADADAERVWLRAYVASEAAPAKSLQTFFFADIDDRDDTGGPAYGQPLGQPWTTDPTPGGYERAVGVSGDGMLLGVWSWNTTTKAWEELRPRKDDARVAVGRDEDPIRIGARNHGYVQADLLHELTGLTASCAGNLFVRTWNDAPAPRAFGDDDAEAYDCRPPADAYGDPVVIRSAECRADEDCPNDGRCRDGVCLFAYPCSNDGECRRDERCTGGACIRVVDTTCTEDAQCDGLVCENGACVACSESGAAACGDGLACSPNGICVATDDYVPGATMDGGASGASDGGAFGGASADAGMVRGGAFHCAMRAANAESGGKWLWAIGLFAMLLRRAFRREGRAS